MTPTNAARDALEDLIEAVDKALENGDHETVLAKAGILTLQHGDTLHSILTALSSVDFAALGAALNSLDKEKAKALYPEVAFVCIDPVDFVALEKAALQNKGE